MILIKNIQDLPSEILHVIFSHLEDKKSICSARLVSRRIKDVASAFLILKASVRMTSATLADFEELSNHPVYSKSIREVSIITSYYDVNLSADLSLFAQHCASSLYQYLERRDRNRRATQLRQEDGLMRGELWNIISRHEIQAAGRRNHSEEDAKPMQKFIWRLHEIYKQRCSDQEELRKNNEHVRRIRVALQKLPGLRYLALRDDRNQVNVELDESDFTDTGYTRRFLKHFDWALSPSNWCGFFNTAYSTTPPIEMLGELCSQMGLNGIRPHQIEVILQAPANLRCLQLSVEQQGGVRDLVSQSTSLKLSVNGWARKGSLAEDNNRPRAEMLSLCSFSQHFFNAPRLARLNIEFWSFPIFYETPTISLADILPLQTPWPNLADLKLSYQPGILEEIQRLVDQQGQTLKKFSWDYGWLLEGRWTDTVDVLRKLQNLEATSLKYPRGDRFGDRRGNHPVPERFPTQEACDYVLRKTDINPLIQKTDE